MHHVEFVKLRKLPNRTDSLRSNVESLLMILEDVLGQVRSDDIKLILLHLLIHIIEINLPLVILEFILDNLLDFLSIGRL